MLNVANQVLKSIALLALLLLGVCAYLPAQAQPSTQTPSISSAPVAAAALWIPKPPYFTRNQERTAEDPELQRLAKRAQETGVNNFDHCQPAVAPNSTYHKVNTNTVWNGQQPWYEGLCPQGRDIVVCYNPSKGPRHWDQCDLDVVQARAVWCKLDSYNSEVPGQIGCLHLPYCPVGSSHGSQSIDNEPGKTCRWHSW